MSIIGIILSIIAIICGICLIFDEENENNIWGGILLVLFNIVLLFIHIKNLGCI